MRFSRRFELQGGRFKIPFGRDALASGANLDFVSRSLLGRQLAPGRDVGVMAHGRLSDRLTYDAGYFLHDGDNSRSGVTEGGDHAVAGRIEFQPFTARKNSRLEPLEIGVAVLRSQLDDSLGLRGQTVFGDGDFFERVFADGRRLRVGADAEWSRGPFGLSGEFARTWDARNAMGLEGEDLPGTGAIGWYVSGAWVVTGERKRARVEPRKSVLAGGLGAVEIAARLERLGFDAVVYPGGRRPRAAPGGSGRQLDLGVDDWRHLVRSQPREAAGEPDSRVHLRSGAQPRAARERPLHQRRHQPAVRVVRGACELVQRQRSPPLPVRVRARVHAADVARSGADSGRSVRRYAPARRAPAHQRARLADAARQLRGRYLLPRRPAVERDHRSQRRRAAAGVRIANRQQTESARGHEPLRVQPAVRRARRDQPRQRLFGPVDDARPADDEDLRAPGRSGPAAGPCAAVRQRRRTPASM